VAVASVELIVNAQKAINPLKRVTAESKKLEGVTRDVNGRLRDSRGKFVSTGQAAAGAAKGVNKLGAAVRGLIAGFGVFQAGKFVIFKTAELERQTKSLEVLTGSLGNARNIIAELQQFGAVTPFTSSELIETAKRLKAFGFETKQVVDVTKRLADVAGATGADLSGIATAFGQIQAKGRLQGEELLQLQERGVGLQDELRKMYKLTADDFRKALEGGRISADAVNVALKNITETGGKYAGGAIAQSDTLAGKFSTLIDGIENISRTIGEVLAPALKGVLGVAIDVVNSINAAFNAQKRLSGFGIDDQERNKLFRQAGEEAQQIALLRGGGKIDSGEFTKIRQQIFSDLINQFGFETGQLIPEIGVPQSDTKLPDLLKRTTSPGTGIDSEGQAEAQLKRQMEAAQSLSTEFQRQIELTNELDDAKDRILQRDFEIADLNAKFPDLKDEEIEKLEELIHKLHDAKEGEIARTEAANDAAKAAEAARKAQEADPLFQMQQQFEELIKLENQVAAGATSIGTAFSNAFGAVVTGAKTGQEALADMLKSIASDFLAMAKKIIAQQLIMILYQTILKALGGPSFNSPAASPGGSAGVAGIGGGGLGDVFGNTSSFGTFAEGGFVNKPTNALIGEGGEPEYVIPASKMRESMARYSRGSRGGGVIPSDGGSSASGDGGVAVAAPIDVRYTVERINSVDYVTADQFQSGMQRAASQGAQRGEQNTLKRLQMSGSTRRRLGM